MSAANNALESPMVFGARKQPSPRAGIDFQGRTPTDMSPAESFPRMPRRRRLLAISVRALMVRIGRMTIDEIESARFNADDDTATQMDLKPGEDARSQWKRPARRNSYESPWRAARLRWHIGDHTAAAPKTRWQANPLGG